MGKIIEHVTVQLSWLAIAAKLLGKKDDFKSIATTLMPDAKKTSKLLDWQQSVYLEIALLMPVVRLKK